MPFPSSSLFPSDLLFPGHIPDSGPVSDGHSTVYTIGDAFAAVNNGQPYVDDDGTWWKVSREEGWSTPPDARAIVTDNPVTDGQRSAYLLNSGRQIILGGWIWAADQPRLQAAMDKVTALLNGMSRTDTLTVAEPVLRRHITVRRNQAASPTTPIAKVSPFAATFVLNLVADDARRLGDLIVASTGLPISTGGLTWPVTWPMEWDATSASGTLHIDNPGPLSGPVLLRITGPCTGPYVRHVSSGREMVFSTDYTLAAGNFLEIDMDNKTILENGQPSAPRNGYLVRGGEFGWFSLDPGPNDIIFGAQAYNPAAMLTANVYPAYP